MTYDGPKIASLRKRRGWNASELARQSGLKQPSIWALENQVTKKPKADTLMRVAAALGVPLREILRPGRKNAADPQGDLAELFPQLDQKNQLAILAAIRSLIDSQK